MTWQEPLVALIVLAAVAFIVWRFLPRRAKRSKKPDVKAKDLVKKDR